MTAAPFLVARVGAERVGFAVDSVREVAPVARVATVPAALPALRGVMPLREHYVSVVSLAALLGGGAAPPEAAPWAVVVRLRGADVALEVDEVETVVERAAVQVQAGSRTAAVRGVWRCGEALVAVLDLESLAERMAGAPAGGVTA